MDWPLFFLGGLLLGTAFGALLMYAWYDEGR